MKILCDITVITTVPIHSTTKRKKSTLAIGLHPANQPDATVFMIIFNSTSPQGKRYRLQNNVSQIITKFVNDGRTTIILKEPPETIMIGGCNVVELKAFLLKLRMLLTGRDATGKPIDRLKIGGSNLAATAIPKSMMPIKKLNIQSVADYPVKGLPKTLEQLTINNIRKCSINKPIYSLQNLKTLDLKNNSINFIPPEVGQLRLSFLDLSSNELNQLHDWKFLLHPNIRRTLINLNISNNRLIRMPNEIVKIECMENLNLSDNMLVSLPVGIRRLGELKQLHLQRNQLKFLPINLQFKFGSIRFDDNPWLGPTDFSEEKEMLNTSNKHQPLRLDQIAAKNVQMIIGISTLTPDMLPCDLLDRLMESPICYRCWVHLLDDITFRIRILRDQACWDVTFCSILCLRRHLRH